jgi:phytoene synthase
MQLVRDADRDRYLATLYAPAEKRDALFALYAFNAEIAGIRDKIREPMVGEIRLQWWRDALSAGTVEAAAGHPVASALVAAIDAHGLPVQALQNMIDARVFDLYDDPMPTRGDLEGYCGETASALIQLAALVIDPQSAASVSNLAGHAGCAQVIAGLLRLVPIHRARGQCFVPLDILSAAGNSREEWISGAASAGNDRAYAAMTALAREHLQKFREGAEVLPVALRAAFLPLALTPAYLDRLEQAGQGAPADIANWRRHWLLFRHATHGWR